MIENQETFIGDTRYFITEGQNELENTEYIQLNEEGAYKPTPAMFISRIISSKDVTVSMHFEGLSLNVLYWFLNHVNNYWGLDNNDISMQKSNN